jgi:hypothetical protein
MRTIDTLWTRECGKQAPKLSDDEKRQNERRSHDAEL